ncbi:LysR family transcriptional regulator [Moraxella bovis]|uniref:Cyn operon transcriptional activator n=1 Tax=Moraxella bovis TaxID=476 RepID=A0A378PZ04_MORBO|nr:LysR family transcriptional regulator [Moraxella bovis]UYZ67449.1 LysR family transcriptional regulator [Moraxella bovis]UYZ69809.1 LysR family transcriptional regulator [Moraxella bovis]UYZ74270.1 LysR family transcriptional regulator [Moraxella bovis]UYZ76872.1 LysR family transcriptional regulator [Moraxella bovis]UYZ77178.1 LysR family transcriptional regulator [Moraxella bovis]
MLLDNLRAMAVFVAVVRHGSFSGAAKELNITTSAVSQQIRSLENELGAVLLQRSTRRVSLTEVGELFYQSALKMVMAAEMGWHQASRLRDNVMGNLTIATTPQVACQYLMPALADWLVQNESLSLHFMVRGEELDMTHDRVDICVGFVDAKEVSEHDKNDVLLTYVPQLLLASGDYLDRHAPIHSIDDLAEQDFILLDGNRTITFATGETVAIKSRLSTNSSKIALKLAMSHQGIIKVNVLDAKPFIQSDELKNVLAGHELPPLALVARLPDKEFQPIKVQRCLDILVKYFANLE